jgi:hypothetical protein
VNFQNTWEWRTEKNWVLVWTNSSGLCFGIGRSQEEVDQLKSHKDPHLVDKLWKEARLPGNGHPVGLYNSSSIVALASLKEEYHGSQPLTGHALSISIWQNCMCVLYAESSSAVLLIVTNIRLQYSWESKSEEVLNWNPELNLIVAVDWTCTYACIAYSRLSLSRHEERALWSSSTLWSPWIVNVADF